MVRRNNNTNRLIMWVVTAGDFLLLNALLYVFYRLDGKMGMWHWEQFRMFVGICNGAMLVSEWKFHTTIHNRVVSAGDVLKLIANLTATQALLAYLIMRHLMYWTAIGWLLFEIGTVFFIVLSAVRLLERNAVKRMRRLGYNTRTLTLVGQDSELKKVYELLKNDPTTGYQIDGYYSNVRWIKDDGGGKRKDERWRGTIADLKEALEQGREITLGDDLYVCISRKENEFITKLSQVCDSQVTRFYYIPVSVESIGLNFKREYINDIEIFTTHESPLDNVVNKIEKRAFDIVVAIVALVVMALIFPFIYVMIKLQSPGPILFKQKRTGLDGKDFVCYKFRSMHVNKDADKLQATKNDPRKYPFGDFMRKMNIDELPQFWNVLIGNMSVVGPRPHMLAHTEMYSQKIGTYMVRHFVKPGITGWAQVTGFRGETKELWQMEERVRRDIWYLEHWSIWLDLRIVWMTLKTVFVHDEKAY